MVFDRRCRGLSSIPSDAATFTTLELTESDELSLAAPVIVRTLDPVLLNGVRELAPGGTEQFHDASATRTPKGNE
jgi:hypothetical protein